MKDRSSKTDPEKKENMAYEIKVPSPGESITQVQVAKWLAEDGSSVEKDQEVVEIDSDKATFPLTAPEDGILKILVAEGETVAIGAVIASVEPGKAGQKPSPEKKIEPKNEPSDPTKKQRGPAARISPLAEKIIADSRIRKEEILETYKGRRIGKKEVEALVSRKTGQPQVSPGGERGAERKKMSALRQKLAERLVAVRNETAMLTTFNEVNMRKVLEIKEKYSAAFKEKYGIGLGLTSFFAKAAALAAKEFPQVNSMIDGDELVTPNYMDIGIAVSAPKGLLVPVIRNAEKLTIPQLEVKIKELSGKARENRISLDDMQGGTFTITNGGIFGSLLSTPILNPPQSAILGLHNIVDRPIAVEGKVEIHPMMYVALSYDHRVIDGRESVGFLVKIKEFIEDPCRMVPDCEDPYRILLGL
jgi:2-oxoglutarate dehydrogenase E2 component (dihydrolipoamide succinyltransferase)